MIVYLALAHACDTITELLPNYLKPMRGRIIVLTYQRLAHMAELPAATYVFTDFERMNWDQLDLAQQVYEWVRNQRPDLRLVNEPRRAVPRFDFLRALEREGLNRHRVYRAHEIDDSVRYPVFVRMDNDHFGPRTSLLQNRTELEEAILIAVAGGVALTHLMIVEYLDAHGRDGLFRAAGAAKFGGAAGPRHLIFSENWTVKAPDFSRGDRWTEAMVAEEAAFLESVLPPSVERAYELAGLEYGRMDYFPADGFLNVWEINSNPNLIPNPSRVMPERSANQQIIVDRVLAGLEQLDHDGPTHPGIRHRLTIPARGALAR